MASESAAAEGQIEQEMAVLFENVQRLTNAACQDCGGTVCGHAAVCSIVLGFRTTGRCLACLARAVERPLADLRQHLLQYVIRRKCYRTAWVAASRSEGCGDRIRPECIFPATEAAALADSEGEDPSARLDESLGHQSENGAARSRASGPHNDETPVERSRNQETPAEPLPVEGVWDAGDMACGELLLELRLRLQKLRPGAVLQVIAHDPSAPEDLPAWGRLTGHACVRFHHPVYFIQRKESSSCPAAFA